MIAGLLRTVARYLPRRSDVAVARRLTRAAGGANDRGDQRVAALLYEEALCFRPERAGLHVQAGHMHKEAGALAKAEVHYLQAQAMLPADADLALQLGHFYKVAGRPDEAEAAYRRALALKPGWADPLTELARIGTIVSAADGHEWVVPALLPRPHANVLHGEGVHIHRLGVRGRPTPWGELKQMRGIEAVRGHIFSAAALDTLRILIDGEQIHCEPLGAAEPSDIAKYPFNAWLDLGSVEPGPRRIDLQFVAGGAVVRTHRETIAVLAPTFEPSSDASIALPLGKGTLARRIAALPSVARPAARAGLTGPIRTILVQRADQLGDLVCSVPAIRQLRALFPDARLIGLVTPANADLAATLGLFDDIVMVPFAQDAADGHRALGIEAQDRLRRTLAAYDFDLAIDLAQAPASRPLLLLSGARFLYGFSDSTCPWLDAGFALTAHDGINRGETLPPSRKLLALVDGLAALCDEGEAAPSRAPAGRYIILHGGARLPWTGWPHYRALAAMLLANTDRDIVLLGDGAALPDSLPADPRLRVIDGLMPFAEFDRLLAGAALFIGNDSGPKHLAALRGVPVLSLHMARLDWREWGQEGQGTILSRRVPCAGCAIGEPQDCAKGLACIRDITTEEAMAEALRLL